MEACKESEADVWSLDAGDTQWYLYDLATKKILEDPSSMIHTIRCSPDTPRQCRMKQQALIDIRLQIDKHIKNTYLKSVQAPINAPKPKLLAWMELN